MSKKKVAILGSGNIGADLMYKVERSEFLELGLIAGIDASSPGLALAKSRGHRITTNGIDELVEHPEFAEIVFDATSASAQLIHSPVLKKLNKMCIDLTPAKTGKMIVPVVNFNEIGPQDDNISLVSCGAQATIPIVSAISNCVEIEYAEIVATIASESAGLGTRQNIDEFTETTAKAIAVVGKAKKTKAIIVLNPAEPPIMMRNTIYVIPAKNKAWSQQQIKEEIYAMVARVKSYVPGYSLEVEPIFDKELITVVIRVEGSGDFLPVYSGNLDIITSAGVATAELLSGRSMSDWEVKK